MLLMLPFLAGTILTPCPLLAQQPRAGGMQQLSLLPWGAHLPQPLFSWGFDCLPDLHFQDAGMSPGRRAAPVAPSV